MAQMSELFAHGPIDVINASGIAALGAKLAEDQRTSPVTARAYSHPALEAGVVVIRLEPDAVAEGTDAEMAAFGFSAPVVTKALGQVRSRTLGFPAWALVHEPKKAKAALDVTEDMRKAKRLVQAKPGHAKEAFEKIAKQLQRTAPQFLPSFWEEVGRVVADQASSSMAAQCFERARQAERAYKLKTDPETSDEAFVEFALLGALSAKTLSQYAKDLVKQAGGAEAYRRFRAIVVKRALGGMPPYSGMGKDLTSLAKAAKADEQAESDKLIAELIEAPGVNKAPIEFWTTYRDSLLRLAKQKPELRARLRAIWPEPRGGSDDKKEEFAASWMDLLAEVGALDDLPDDGLGAWLSKMFKFAGKTPRTEGILEKEAPRLIKLDQAVACSTRARWGYDLHLDLAEKILQLGVSLAKPEEHDDFSHDTMTVDPVMVAGHAVFGKKLVESVASMIGNAEHEHRMRGKSGFTAARRMWIEEQIASLEAKPFHQLESSLVTLESKTTAETFLPFQDLHERLTRVDLAASLALHLRAGIGDEFGWPAYEEAAAALGSQTNTAGAFPIMTVWNTTKVLALGPSGVIAEHDFVYKPKEHEVEHAYFLDGQFLVDLKNKAKWETVQYWSSKPKDRFEQKFDFSLWGGSIPDQWSPPGGGVTLGGKVFHAGDHVLSRTRNFLCDGTTMWFEDDDKWFTYDPVKDSKTKSDPPPWVAEFAREGWNVTAVLQPAPAGLASSPLGLRDGLIGSRWRSKKDDWESKVPTELERIDGLSAKLTRGGFGLIQFPGDDVPRVIDAGSANSTKFLGGEGPGCELVSPTGDQMCILNNEVWASRGWGTVLVPPATFWDYLTPRDPAGSTALRALTTEQASRLLAVAREDVAATEKAPRPLPRTEAAVREVLPQVTDAKLIAGIAGIAERAAELAIQCAEIAATRAKEHADPSGQALLGEAAQLRKIAKALAAGKELKIANADVDPREWLHHVRARAALSLGPLGDADARRKAREMVQALSGTIFAEDLSRMRTFELQAPDDWDNNIDWGTVLIQKHEGSTYVIDPNSDWGIELSSDGKFRTPPVQDSKHMWKVTDEKKLSKGIGTQWADRFLELPDEAVAWDPEIGVKLAEKSGLGVTEAILLWINVSSMSTWSKDFLGKKQRELLGGIKVADADAAKTTFEEIDADKMLELWEKAVPDDPMLLRTPLAPGGLVERLGAAWKAKFGKRAKIPQDLIAAAKKDLELSDLGKLLPGFAGGADDSKFLKPDRRALDELNGYGDDALNDSNASDIVMLVSWLFLSRPVGCSIRAGIPDVVEKIEEVFSDDKLLWPFESFWFDKDDKKDVAKRDGLIEAVGGKPVELPKDDDGNACDDARDDGAVIVAAYGNRVYAAFRPAKLDKARKKIEQLAKLLTVATDYEDADSDGPDPNLVTLQKVDLLRSDAFKAFAERVKETPVPEGGYEANPAASVPKLVDKVAKELGVSKDAAVLYLQTLALAEPTQARVCLWNDWKPKQYKDASAELVKKKLLVEGKRERAGRTLFIKGGYSKGERKNLPMEEWKQPFYTGLERHLPTEPCHLLFARAWKRVEDGDKPS
jgi:hypothetical protein